MSSTFEKQVKGFHDLSKRTFSYIHALNVLHWDLRTAAPRKGMDPRSEMIGVLSGEHFKLSTSSEMGEYLQALSEPATYEQLDPVTKKLVELTKKDFERSKRVPPDRYQEFVVLTSQAETVWEEARANNDFKMFQPYLEKIIAMTLEFIDYWGVKTSKYDTLLDQYEPGMTTDVLDGMFKVLRDKSVPLLKALVESGNRPDTSFLQQPFDVAQQEAFSRFVVERIGFDFQAGVLAKSTHPFCTSFGPNDVRMTTRYDENDIRDSFFSTIHETGHAIYEQNINPELFGTLLCDGTSMGIHESQSRFIENILGRSLPFWQHFYGDLQNHFPTQFKDVSLEQFYRAINISEPSLIRTDADELTYNLHIMVRYEIEKGLISQELNVADLPGIWNEKYKEYLGIDVPNDKMGVLQDVHWAGGSIGYFPTYSLGNVYAAQFTNTLKKEITNYDELVSRGEFAPIIKWYNEKIHQYGKLKDPSELVVEITGEQANAQYLVEYLEQKFKSVYGL
ncbi:carboxypeptidase M32 [Brevibacillus dissolubilis]|uniref:carboxypeptidase M32 n=1 Tax=Brevibacillus dissolubilis TaxID=1844116 RepID=UPI0011165F0D|nr:carboxypeptidase M32 [Brevibacillus dissolubilis]